MKMTILFLMSLTVLAACGGSDSATNAQADKATNATAKAAPAPAAKPAPKPAPEPEPETPLVVDDGTVATVTLTANDAMQYNAKTIEISAGRTVKLTLKHVGKMPAEMMGHNFVLLAADTDVTAFTTAGAPAKDTDYIAPAMDDKVLAKTKLLGGGESDTIEFQAPAAGTYTFLCSFPGHSAIMKGTLVVK